MSFFNDVINIVVRYYPQLLDGVGNTMLIALIGTVAGLVIGLLTGVVRTAPLSKNAVLRVLHKILNAIIAVYVEIFRGTPMLVHLSSVIYYMALAFLRDGVEVPHHITFTGMGSKYIPLIGDATCLNEIITKIFEYRLSSENIDVKKIDVR